MTNDHASTPTEPTVDPETPVLTRRNIVLVGLGGIASAVLAACGRGGSDSAQSSQGTATTQTTAAAGPATTGASATTVPAAAAPVTTLAPTPECKDADDLTPAQTEGPYFTANSPEVANIRPSGTGGTRLVLSGTVVTTACQPVGRALVDFWQADGDGNYDNSGYRFRGHQFTDGQGRYRLETVIPGLYPGRTRHIHVKVQAPNGPILTTQLYFPGEARNATDGIYREECQITIQDASDGKTGGFQFVVRT